MNLDDKSLFLDAMEDVPAAETCYRCPLASNA